MFGHRNVSSLRYKPFSAYMQNMMFMRPLKDTASDSAIWISLFSTDFEQHKIIGAVTIIIDTPTTRAFHQNFSLHTNKNYCVQRVFPNKTFLPNQLCGNFPSQPQVKHIFKYTNNCKELHEICTTN